ncbi:MAG: hypothetical protein KKA84_06975 [Bacteroidetes bacterium]|nr:hypothetical protein [Bacteroidota bacterium]
MKDFLILFAFLAVFGGFFLAILWALARGAKWNELKNDFPNDPYTEPIYSIKKVVRKVGTLEMAGKGGMKVTFTEAGLRVTSKSPFFSPIMIPYDRIKINNLYKLREVLYIHLKVDHEVEFDIILPGVTQNLVEKYIESLDGMEIAEKHFILDVGIG